MDSHDPERIATGQSRQYWRAFWPIMHLHENHSIKRAGVAGIRARASSHLSALLYVMVKNLGNIYSLHLQSRS
ncbi:hypothetical protein RAF90_25765, partial [Klebsiella pneumoniae]